MMRGEIDYLHEVSRDSVEFVEREAAVGTYPLLRPYYVVLVFNLRHPILGKREVRIALNEAVDRAVVVRDGMRGKGRQADGPVWPYHWAYSSAQRAHSYNPAAARLRLDGAGLKVRETASSANMASRFRFTCLVPSDDPRFERIALIVQRQLFDLGIDMAMEAVPVGELQVRAARGTFDAFLYEMTSGRTLSWVYRFWHSPSARGSAFVASGYAGADSALDRIRAARSEADTRTGVADLQRALFDDPPAIFLAWPQETRAIDRTFVVPYQRDADVVGTLWQAQLAGPQVEARR
jgi:peptide/nickel transport system substrate-binding protein